MIKYRLKVFWENFRISETGVDEAKDYTHISDRVGRIFNNKDNESLIKKFIIDIIND